MTAMAGMIVSLNFYYARPGNADAVLRQRIRACDVRASLGLPRGQVCAKIEGGDGWPDTLWRLDFPDMAAQDADMAARAASPEFEAIRVGMRQLYRRFERPLYAGNADGDGMFRRGDLQTWSGIFCTDSVRPAVLEKLSGAGISALKYQSGGRDLPQFIACGDLKLDMAGLTALGARIERSLWRLEDPGRD